jgi:hypothetical protein
MGIRKLALGAGLALAALIAAAAVVETRTVTPGTIGRHGTTLGTTGGIAPRRPRIVPVQLQIEGTVIDMGDAVSGTMTIRVGGEVRSVQVTLPDYSISVQSADLDSMIAIDVETPGYKYTSILGTYRKLVRHAGADARLDVSELDRIRLSPFSTALEFFMRRDLGGRLPGSDREQEQVLRSIDPRDVSAAVSVLTAISDGIVALPTEVADGYALVVDRMRYRAFLAEHPEISSHAATLARTPSIAISRGMFPPYLHLSRQMPSDPTHIFVRAGRILATTTAGYELHSWETLRNSSFSGTFTDGGLRLTPRNQVLFADRTVSRFVPGLGYISALERIELLGETFRSVFAGDEVGLWVATETVLATYPQNPQLVPEERVTNEILVASDLAAHASWLDPARLVGKRALPVLCQKTNPVVLAECDYALHAFYSPGTGTTEDVGPKVDSSMQPVGASGSNPFQWRYSRRGSFQVITPTVTVTYWRLDSGDAARSMLAYLAKSRDGNDMLTLSGVTTMINATHADGFGELAPDGPWGNFASFTPDDFDAYAYDEGSFPLTAIFYRNPDGTSVRSQRSTDPAYGDYDLDLNSGWRVFNGRLYDTRYTANANSDCVGTVPCIGFPSCEAAFAAGATRCAPFHVRYFRPLARIGNGLYGIEDLYINTQADIDSPPYVFDRSSRPNYHEKL